MALNIKSDEADRLARELAQATGETITEAVTRALAERLGARRRRSGRREALREIRERAGRLPVIDPRSREEILGLDELGRWR